MTLGTGAVTPMQMAGAYAVFANGGYQIKPYLIRKVVNGRGEVLSEADPAAVGKQAERVLDARNAFLIDSMLRDVVRSGTGHAAGQRLPRRDLAGKTGTTNDAVDGWFAGYGGKLVAVAWMGYDTPKSLGGREFGGTLALPIWADYMRIALRGEPEVERTPPAGLAQLEGEYLYQEYASAAAQQQPSLWDRLFGGFGGGGAGGPAARPSRPAIEEEERRHKEIYGG
jgi:penicillin-binding protein 1A